MSDLPDPLLEGFTSGPNKLEKLVRLVEGVRLLQVKAHNSKSINHRKEAQRAATELDEWIKDYRNPNRERVLF